MNLNASSNLICEEKNVTAKTLELSINGIKINYITDPKDVPFSVISLLNSDRLYFDTEVAGIMNNDIRSGNLRLLTFFNQKEVFIFDWFKIRSSYQCLRDLIIKIPLVGHKLDFDLWYTKKELDAVSKLCLDTLICSRFVTGPRNDVGHSLATCLERHLNTVIDKTCQTSDWNAEPLSIEQIKYAAMDVIVLPSLANKLVEKLNNSPESKNCTISLDTISDPFKTHFGLTHLASIVECSFIPSTVCLEINGIGVNTELLNKSREDIEGVYQSQYTKFMTDYPQVGGPFHHARIATYLKSEGFDLRKTDKNHDSTAKEVLVPLRDKSNFVRDLLDLRQTKNSLDYCCGLIENTSQDHRVHSNFTQMNRVSSRMSSSRPNIQNPPKNKSVRSYFIAPAGKVLMSADFPQIEMRVGGIYMHDQNLTRLFKSGTDIYLEIASRILGRDKFNQLSEKERKEYRTKSKPATLATLFLMSSKGFVEYAKDTFGIEVSLEFAQDFCNTFLSDFIGVAHYHQMVKDHFRSNDSMFVSTLLGRRLLAHTPQQACNLPIQSSTCELLKVSVIFLRKKVMQHKPKLSGKLVNLVHDDIILEINPSEVDIFTTLLKSSMVEAGKSFGVPISTSEINVKVGHSWADLG